MVAELPEEAEEDDSDNESEAAMDTTSSEQSLLINQAIACLNSPEFLAGVVKIVEQSEAGQAGGPLRSESSENIRNICKICHQLLIYNNQVGFFF